MNGRRDGTRTARARALGLGSAAALALAGCTGGGTPTSLPPVGAAPTSGGVSGAAPGGARGPDGRGVFDAGGFEMIAAREGDTVESMASRVGLSAAELAAYNGLPVSYRPQPGDELVLPPRPGGYLSGSGAPTPSPADPALASAPAPISEPLSIPAAPSVSVPGEPAGIPGTAAAAAGGSAASGGDGWSPERIGAALEGPGMSEDLPEVSGAQNIVYHEVGAEETVYSIARTYGVPAETLIAWNGLSGPGYTVQPGQVLTIPGDGSGRPPAASSGLTAPGQGTLATPPPSSAAPLPPDTAPAVPLASPQLSQFQRETGPGAAPAAASPEAEVAAVSVPEPAPAPTADPAPAGPRVAPGGLMRPHPGDIARPFESGAGRSDGVEFAAAPGDPVRASADGEVALVSTSLGEWGTIVLVRHDEELMTVYGRLSDAAVAKGQRVAAGQVLGSVASPASGPARLHFEVRRGAFSEDPSIWLQGG